MSSSMNPLFIKSASATVIAGLLDKFVLGEPDMLQSAYFGVATGVGVGAGSYLATMVPPFIPDSAGLYTGSALQSRVVELGAGIGATYALDRFLSKPDNASLTSKLLVVFATDFISEYIKDYVTTQPLAYLQ